MANSRCENCDGTVRPGKESNHWKMVKGEKGPEKLFVCKSAAEKAASLEAAGTSYTLEEVLHGKRLPNLNPLPRRRRNRQPAFA